MNPLVVNGWTLFAHPLFVEQVETVAKKVARLRAKHPREYKKKNATKRLAAILSLAFEVIPQDPTRSEYRQGSTLGAEYKHWFRAKFFQQYRLFFRYHEASKVIVYGAHESSNDAYRVFKAMLDGGNPPDDWDALLTEAKSTRTRLVAESALAELVHSGVITPPRVGPSVPPSVPPVAPLGEILAGLDADREDR